MSIMDKLCGGWFDGSEPKVRCACYSKELSHNMENSVVTRDDQIGLLADANVRQQARAQHWLDKDVVRNFIRDFHARTHELKSPPRLKACG